MADPENPLSAPCPNCGRPIPYVKGFVGELNCKYCHPKDEKPKFTKHDADKIRLELIPPSLLRAVGTILTFGAKKYDDDNWRKCEKWSRYYGALLRHLNAWWDGEDLDSESGHSHLWHAGCCLAFLIEFEASKISTDDRRKNEPA